MIGLFARPLAGHDKNEIYVIVSEEQNFVYLANGRNKKISNPKKKNKKHIQVIKKQIDINDLSDLKIKSEIKKYLKN